MKTRISLSAFCVLAISCICLRATAQSQPIDAAALLGDMVDLSKLAEFPDPPYTTKQFSSYDRASTTPDDARTWFANGDSGKYLRVETTAGRQEYVMADMQGPGAIVRIWSANPAGTIRIYLDGGEKPVIEAPMQDLLSGKFPGLPAPLAHVVSRGWNLYFPITYAKSCKVTSDRGGFYYHVNYRTYAGGTNVKTFALDQLQTLSGRIAEIAARLSSPRGPSVGDPAASFNDELTGPASSKVSLSGSKAISDIVVKVPAENREAVLRGVIMRITFDGEQTIEAPLGDFFGSGPGLNAFESLPLGMTKDGEMWSHWFMPFRTTAVIEFINRGLSPARFSGMVLTTPYTWTASSMYFHAKWRAQFDVPTRPMQDWNYMTAKGKGVFVGTAFTIDNPVKGWWGEGDEKIYVDGEKFPSHFGTGTEDYFGYAWSSPLLFGHAYHNQPRCDGPGTAGRTSVNRFDILDRIPFNTDFKFDMELWHSQQCIVNLAVTDYWYARAGASDGFKPITAADVVLRPAPVVQVTKVPGAIEAESMRVIQKTATAGPQDLDNLSGGQQLWWRTTPRVGDTLILGFNVEKAGKYRVLGRFVKARDYGIVQLAINDQKAGSPIDFYNPSVIAANEIELGVFELKQGENRFSATITGANDRALKQYMFGMDYLLLKPAE